MRRLVFLVEEPSIAEVLKVILPRILPDDIAFQTVPHQGKSDLERSIPVKMRAWKEPGVQFVVVRDNDGGDCKALKEELFRLCMENGRSDSMIRIVCQELEAWYLGDLEAVAAAYHRPALSRLTGKQAFRHPDRIAKPSKRIADLVPEFGKIAGARMIAPHLNLHNNRSVSFQVFISGVSRLCKVAPHVLPQHLTVQPTLDLFESDAE